MKPTKKLDDLLLKLLNEHPTGIRMTDFEKILKGRLSSRGVTDYYKVGSPHTIIEALRRLQKQGYAKKDIDSRKYLITVEGEKYVPKSEIVDYILSSKWFDSKFSWNPTSKEPEIATYNLVQSDGKSGDSMALLLAHLERIKTANWKNWLTDILNYAVRVEKLDAECPKVWIKWQEGTATSREIDLLMQNIVVLWNTLFSGVERLSVVQTVNPQLLLERINSELNHSNQN